MGDLKMCLSRKQKKKLQDDLLKLFAVASEEVKLAKLVELWADYGEYSKRDRELLDRLVAMLAEGK
jgi:hypothetical protein